MVNRGNAGFCRACGGKMEGVLPDRTRLRASEVDFLTVKGRFRRPPLVVDGMLCALATDGVLHQISPRRGAQSKVVGTLGVRGAGFNRNAAVRVAAGEKSIVHGWVYLAASRDGIAAVSLATGDVVIIEQARSGESLSANSSEADATGFRGLVANEDFYGFAATTGEQEVQLTIRSFSRDSPAWRPLVLHGKRLAGPVLHDGLVVMCTEEEAGVVDMVRRVAVKMPLPEGFVALLRPSSEEMSVAPGCIPMVGTRGRDGELRATIAGLQDGASGTLELAFMAKAGRFQRRPVGTSFYSNSDGSLSISALDRVEWMGGESGMERVRSLAPGMPVSIEGEMRLWFAEQEYKGSYRVMLSRGEQITELYFSDPKCTKDTCCGIYFVGSEVLICFLADGSGDGMGLRFAHWSLV